MHDQRTQWTVEEAAEVLGVRPSRVAKWIDGEHIIKPTVVLRTRFLSRRDLVRLALLLDLQSMLGEKSPMAVAIARGLPDDVVSVLDGLDLEDEDEVPSVIFRLAQDRVSIERESLKALAVRIREVALV